MIFRFLLDAKEQLRRPCRLIRRKSGRRCPKGKGIARPLPAAGFQGTLTNRFESSKNGKTPPAGGVFPKFVDCRRCGIAASQGLLSARPGGRAFPRMRGRTCLNAPLRIPPGSRKKQKDGGEPPDKGTSSPWGNGRKGPSGGDDRYRFGEPAPACRFSIRAFSRNGGTLRPVPAVISRDRLR